MNIGDVFTRDMPTFTRGKTRTVEYTVTGFIEIKGIDYVLVRSLLQGDGLMRLADARKCAA